MNNEPVAYINVEERKLEWAKPTAFETPTIAKMDRIPLYTQPHPDNLGLAESIIKQQQVDIAELKAYNTELHGIEHDLEMKVMQQQAEIAELKNARDHWCLQYKDVFNKLEANCYGDGNVYRGVRSKDSEVQTIHIGGVRELSDEEILQQALFSFGNESENFDDSYWVGFARAILRKAQEK